jgi:hypothetical protein
MKKKLIILLIGFIAIFQQLKAQGDPGLLTIFKIEGNLRTGCHFNWTISVNEAVTTFILEKSENGWDFITIASIQATQKRGLEKYHYQDSSIDLQKMMYRIKMLTRGQTVYYSKIITYQVGMADIKHLAIRGNPVKDKLTISFNSASNQIIDLQVFSVTGIKVASQKINSSRNNVVSIPLNPSLSPGIYIAQLNDGIETQTTKFVKQ